MPLGTGISIKDLIGINQVAKSRALFNYLCRKVSVSLRIPHETISNLNIILVAATALWDSIIIYLNNTTYDLVSMAIPSPSCRERSLVIQEC